MLKNLAIGLPLMLLCLVVQIAFAFWAVRHYVRRTRQSAHPPLQPLLLAMLVLTLGNFVQIVAWGLLFMLLGEFTGLYDAVYHSGVNFTSLGYGDVVMSAGWKLLGPLEALNGILMLGSMTSEGSVRVLNAKGELLIARSFQPSSNVSLDMGRKLSPGNYILRVTSKNTAIQKRIAIP